MHIGDSVHRVVDWALRRRFAAPTAPEKACALCGTSTEAYAVFGASPLVRACPSCETECLDPVPTSEELLTYYSGYATTQWPESRLPELIRWGREGVCSSLRRLGREPQAVGGATWLEVGFGAGASVFAAAELGARVCGIDIDPLAVERARAYATKQGLDVELTAVDIEGLVATGRRFDFVKASHVIEHTQDPQHFLACIHKALKPGGVLILECPNNRAFLWLLKNATRSIMGREMFYNSLKRTEHIWGFTRAGLIELVESLGFRVADCIDYSVADPEYQPDVALWYPRWPQALSSFARERRRTPLVYATARTVDRVSSRVAHAGSALALIAVRSP